jgi:D-lactate dehydrogenase
VLVTGHQAFLTERALYNIANTTLANLSEYEKTGKCANAVTWTQIRGT